MCIFISSLFRRGLAMSRCTDCDDEAWQIGKEMPDRSHCDSGSLFGKSDSKKNWLRSTKHLCGSCGFMPQAFTLDVMEAITIDAILNCSSRLTMPCRTAIQAKSV
jgi:hypothetical protein